MDSITIILQPKDLYATDERQTGFVVQAITESGAEISYQWQKSTEPDVWKNVGVNSNIISFVASMAMNGHKYRAILTSGSYSTGLTVLSSDIATVYVSPRPTITPTPTMTPTPPALPVNPRINLAGVKNLVLDQSTNKLYASAGSSIKVIDTISDQIISNYNITSPANIWKIIGNSSSLYVSDIINYQIIQLSKSNGSIEKITNINAYPMDIQLNDDFLYVLATSYSENSLKKIQNGEVTQSLSLSKNSMDRFSRLLVSRNKNKAYILDTSSESILVVDLRYMNIENTIYLPKGSKPESMEIDSSFNSIFIPTKDSGYSELLLLDINSNSLLESRIAIPYNGGEQINVINFTINSLKNNIYLADAYKPSPIFILNTKNQTFTSIDGSSNGCNSLIENLILNKLYVANGNSGIDIVQLSNN